ncbi:MAG: hypothetical protein WCO56_29055 [Verrucomicrobiota bacterium]
MELAGIKRDAKPREAVFRAFLLVAGFQNRHLQVLDYQDTTTSDRWHHFNIKVEMARIDHFGGFCSFEFFTLGKIIIAEGLRVLGQANAGLPRLL